MKLNIFIFKGWSMKYCTECFYPETKPDLLFNDQGVCSACTAFKARDKINWGERKQQFSELVKEIKSQNINNNYDCIIPVSGGKDSHFQVLTCLEYGLNPLAVCAHTCDLSEIGRQNLNNLTRYCDLIEVHTNKSIRLRLNKLSLQLIGDISWPEHVTIFTIPVNEAVIRQIPLIIWGENPQNEYGGPDEESQTTSNLSKRWLQEFGGLNGLRVNDLFQKYSFKKEDLIQYDYSNFDYHPFFPKIKSIFLGYYFPWNGYENAKNSLKYGFKFERFPVLGNGSIYENLDNYQTGIHDYFKYIKFGFGRATDIANNNLRRGIFTRYKAIRYIVKYDGNYPYTYLGKGLDYILSDIDMTRAEFIEITNKFTNEELFKIVNNKVVPKFLTDLLDK